ncbi:MAG: hypothetical protein EZS28_019412 [Streblomastix strix]|uniref:Uncharacterized protein n=1 Tax=Streblomastix strix TaxID=222440 RepID=A0A5J4VRX1_9EUKA|nr:MAG: hypothetical protein EZS28_019412 [Streblomastix strix]
MKAISEALASQTAVPYFMTVNFTESISLNDVHIFSAFSEYSSSLFGDLKIKFKINPLAFIYFQTVPVISLVIFYKICKDELMSSYHDKLKDIDLFFRNQSLKFKYTTILIQIRCTADFITGIRAEEFSPSRLKNLVCDIRLVTISVRNCIIIVVTANMSGYKASE